VLTLDKSILHCTNVQTTEIETIKSFDAITKGDADDIPEQAFMYVGGLESAREKAKNLK